MFSYVLVYKKRPYFNSSGQSFSKFGRFVNKQHILHMTDLISGQSGEKAMKR